MPGLDIRHFCEAVTATSIPQSSKANGMPPIDGTPSTSTSTSCDAATRATAATSFSTPVDVSTYVSASAHTPGCSARNASTSPAEMLRVQSVAMRCTRTPYDSANPDHISPNLPLQQMAISSPDEKRLLIVASSAPRPVV